MKRSRCFILNFRLCSISILDHIHQSTPRKITDTENQCGLIPRAIFLCYVVFVLSLKAQK